MKKFYCLFALFLLLCSVLCLASCAKSEDALAACPNDPEHIFSASLTACPAPEKEGEILYTCVNCGVSYAEALPPSPTGGIDLTIDPEGLTHIYNAAITPPPTYHAMIDGTEVDPAVTLEWFVLNGGTYEPLTVRPTDVGSYRVVATAYYESGDLADSDSADFTIIPAAFPFVEQDRFAYTGASFFEMLPVRACGEDMIGYTVYFENGNAGAEVMNIELSGEKAYNYAIHEEYSAAILPKTVDISVLTECAATKEYDGTDRLVLTWNHTDFPEILEADGDVAVTISAGQSNVCTGFTTTITPVGSDSGNYTFTGSTVLTLSVTPATFTPPATFVYNGQSTMTGTLSTGIGADTVTYSVAFDSKNAGAAMLQNGASLQGEKAGNYAIPATYAPQLLPCEIDLAELDGLFLYKEFNGTDEVAVVLEGSEDGLIPVGETVTIYGNVGQVLPCESTPVYFTAKNDDAGNYSFTNGFSAYLTVQKAQILLSGTCELTYTGDTVMPLPYDADYASGFVAGYPVWLRVRFADKNAGAAAVEFMMHGEYAVCYELTVADFDCRIVAKTVRLTSTVVKYRFNGESERIETAGASFRMLNFRSADDVSAVLRFETAAAGSALLSVELIGADAQNYVLDSEGFTAEIVEAPLTPVVIENASELSGVAFHPGKVIAPIYTPSAAILTYYRVTGADEEPLTAMPSEPGNYRAVIVYENGVGLADSTAEYTFSIVEHDFRQTSSTATCNEGGVAHYECTCGESYDEEAPAAHLYADHGCCERCSRYQGITLSDSNRTVALAAGEVMYRNTELAAGTYTVAATGGTLRVFLFNGSTYEEADATFTTASPVICYMTVANTGTEQINVTLTLQ